MQRGTIVLSLCFILATNVMLIMHAKPVLAEGDASWIPVATLDQPITRANAVVTLRSAFIIGGLTGVNKTPVMDIRSIPTDNFFDWKVVPNVTLPHPIAGKNFAVATVSPAFVFVYYGCSELHFDYPTARSDFYFIDLYRDKRVVPAPRIPHPRCNATIAAVDQMVFVFGGLKLDPRTGKCTSNFAAEIEVFDTVKYIWEKKQPTKMFFPLCHCSTAVVNKQILVFGCINCFTLSEGLYHNDAEALRTNFSIVFSPLSRKFTDVNAKYNFASVFNGTNGVTVQGFAVSVNPRLYYSRYGGNSVPSNKTLVNPAFFHPPPVTMYYPSMQQVTTIVPSTSNLQFRPRVHAALFEAAGIVYMVGGTDVSTGEPTHDVDKVKLVPLPQQPAFRYYGENDKYFAGENVTLQVQPCISPHSMFRLNEDCSQMSDFIPDTPCTAPTITFNTAWFNLPKQLLVCFTQGTCDVPVSARVPVTQNLTDTECWLQNYCWDSADKQCYEYGPLTTGPQHRYAYWTNIYNMRVAFHKKPILPTPLPTQSPGAGSTLFGKKWYETTIGLLIISLTCLLFLAFIGLFCAVRIVRRTLRDDASSRSTTRSSSRSTSSRSFDFDSPDVFNVGNYRVLERIGHGSYGVVYLAERIAPSSTVARTSNMFAIKVIRCNSQKQLYAAVQEFDVAKRLSHDNIIRVLDMFISWECGPAAGTTKGVGAASTSSQGERSSGKYTSRQDLVPLSLGDSLVIGSSETASTCVGSRNLSVTLDDAQDNNLAGSFTPPRRLSDAVDGKRQSTERSRLLSEEHARREETPLPNIPDLPPHAEAALRMSPAQQIIASSGVGSRKSIGAGEESKQIVCIVTEYYSAGDLRQYIQRFEEEDRAVPDAVIVSVARQLADMLTYLHSRRPPVVHRDLKPENILMTTDFNRIVVTDFGQAHYGQSTGERKGRGGGGGGDSQYGGTVQFTAPEAWKRTFTPASDVWALGCILYAMCTQRIYRHNIRIMFCDVHDDDFVQSLEAELEGRPASIRKVIMGALVVDVKQRISAFRVQNILEKAVMEEEFKRRAVDRAEMMKTRNQRERV